MHTRLHLKSDFKYELVAFNVDGNTL